MNLNTDTLPAIEESNVVYSYGTEFQSGSVQCSVTGTKVRDANRNCAIVIDIVEAEYEHPPQNRSTTLITGSAASALDERTMAGIVNFYEFISSNYSLNPLLAAEMLSISQQQSKFNRKILDENRQAKMRILVSQAGGVPYHIDSGYPLDDGVLAVGASAFAYRVYGLASADFSRVIYAKALADRLNSAKEASAEKYEVKIDLKTPRPHSL